MTRNKSNQNKQNGSSHILKGKKLMIPKTFGIILCGLMRQKLNTLVGVCVSHICIKITQLIKKQMNTPKLTPDDGGLMICGCFAT